MQQKSGISRYFSPPLRDRVIPVIGAFIMIGGFLVASTSILVFVLDRALVSLTVACIVFVVVALIGAMIMAGGHKLLNTKAPKAPEIQLPKSGTGEP